MGLRESKARANTINRKSRKSISSKLHRYNDYNYVVTHEIIKLFTLLVKYFNDLLGRQNAERGMDEVIFFYVGDLGTKYANFQAKISEEIFS